MHHLIDDHECQRAVRLPGDRAAPNNAATRTGSDDAGRPRRRRCGHWLREYAKDHPRRGFRHAYHDARGEGWAVNHKKIQRLWREEGLRVPQRRRRKRLGTSHRAGPAERRTHRTGCGRSTSSSTPPPTAARSRSSPSSTSTPANASAAWSTAPSPATTSSTNSTASPRARGYPAVLRCDNGPELACAAMADWAGERVGLSFIPPGEPWRNGYVESFNGRVRDECLNINIFWSLAHARVVITDWKDDYNHRRRHSSLGYQAPAVYAAACTHQ